MNDDMKTVDQMVREQRSRAWKILIASGLIRICQYLILGFGMGVGYILGSILAGYFL